MKRHLTTHPPFVNPDCAVSGAPGTGRRKPVQVKAHKRQSRALFFCPALLYGGCCGARASVAGPLTPVFPTPVPVATNPRCRMRLGGSNHLLRSLP